MILRMPEYCSDFRCTADRCSDNCCIGWEIDIDNKSLEYYRSVDGEFGNVLRENITGENPSSFRLSVNERCPFLNDCNLCEIYINLGEDKLCQICTDHPRYFEWFDGVKEGGTGLACEESARLIITQDRKFSYTETEIPYEDCDEYDDELYRCMIKARSVIIEHLQNRKISIEERISDVVFYTEELQYRTDNGNFEIKEVQTSPEILELDVKKLLELFISLEPLDTKRPDYLKECRDMYDIAVASSGDFNSSFPECSRFLENLAVYFIWRHFMKGVFTGEFYSSVFFMAAGVNIIEYLSLCRFCKNGEITENDIITEAKNFSKETEYSDSNLSMVLDEAYSESSYFL